MSIPLTPVSGAASCHPSWRGSQPHPDGAAGPWLWPPGSSSSSPGEHWCPAPSSAPQPSWQPEMMGIKHEQVFGEVKLNFIKKKTHKHKLTSVIAFLAFSSAFLASWTVSSTSLWTCTRSDSSFFLVFRRLVFWILKKSHLIWYLLCITKLVCILYSFCIKTIDDCADY